jgi:hypothetical protein
MFDVPVVTVPEPAVWLGPGPAWACWRAGAEAAACTDGPTPKSSRRSPGCSPGTA